MRTPPTSPPPVVKRQDSGIITQTRQYKLITPLFGGGVTPAEADPVTTVRATEVRGHLRFWWRACCGGRYGGSLRRMKEAEDALWGAASTPAKPLPSQVQIVVECEAAGSADRPFEVVAGNPGTHGPRPKVRPRQGSVVPPYGAFPLQPGEGEAVIGMDTKSVRKDVAFLLTITYPSDVVQKADVEAALWAWETFGGVGARTRRGFGSLQCTHVDGQAVTAPSQGQVAARLSQGLIQHVVEGGQWPAGVPHLTRTAKMKVTPASSPVAAWRNLLDKLKTFRQQRRPGNQPGRPGRSYWPEPEAIRDLTGQRHPMHQPLPPLIKKFPRAAFGLPIIFHFKDMNRRNKNDSDADPRDTSLQGHDHDRLGSPLILRPLACANGTAVGMALILEGPRTPPGGLVLNDAPHNPPVVALLTGTEVAHLNNDMPLHVQTDVLDAFLNTL